MTFSDYQLSCIDLIKQRRPDYQNASLEQQQAQLNANTPFECIPAKSTKQAVLMIHGLYDSPCMMQSLAPVFLNEHYLVRSLLLPGHGTQPEDLLNMTFEQWLTACRLAISLLPDSIERIVLCGFSTGALLNHYLAIRDEIPQLIGLVSLSPALSLHPLEQALLNSPRLVSAVSERLPWHYQNPCYDYAKYSKHALNAAYQVQRLIAHNQLSCPSPSLHLPVFYVMSANDKVIHSKAIWQNFHQSHPNPKSRCLIYSDTELNTHNDSRLEVRNSCYPEQHIINFSHIALAIAPDHSHYGINGDLTQHTLATLKQPVILGENGGKTTMRLSYNPDFDYMTQQIKKFLANITLV